MKKILMAIICGLLAGCDYTVPLVKSPATEIDRSVLGLWQGRTDDGESVQLLVLPLDKHEYLVSYPAGSKEALYARACLGSAGDQKLVQLKWFGTAEGGLADDDRVFQFVSFSVQGDKLTVRLLNSEVVKQEVASTEELTKAIISNREKPDLFKPAIAFTKVKN